MTSQEIFTALQTQFPTSIVEAKLDAVVEPYIKLNAASLIDVAKYLRESDAMQFDFLSCLSGVDLKGKLGVTYHLFSMVHKHKIILKVEVPTDSPSVPSVESIWKTANWHEREAFDLYGIQFTNHPDLRRILLPYDWEGFPLRKDYQVPEYYNGMKVPY